MNNYNPSFHNRHSIRLKGYNYSQAGLYFITLCVQDRSCLFGNIINGKMDFTDAGIIANECWINIPDHFLNAILHEYVIMPNHVHGIIQLLQKNINDVRVENFQPVRNEFQKIIPHSIGSIVRGYKIGVTKWFRNNNAVMVRVKNFQPLPIWQRNYYERIIRNEKSYHRISEYIANNPANWQNDKLYKQ